MSHRYRFAVATALLLGASASAAPIGGGVAPACDRACMTGIVDRYLAALVRHDPTGLPLNRDVRFTENTAQLKVGGEGLWVGASEPPTGFRIYAIDVGAGQAGFYGVMKERDRPLIIALRLKVVNGQITEIEHVLARGLRAEAVKNLAHPRPEFVTPLPPADRLPRQQMVNIADSYFEAIEHADGKLAPFADDCVRRENGGQTTSGTGADRARSGSTTCPGWTACRSADPRPTCRLERSSGSTAAALPRSRQWVRRCLTERRAVGANS
jgi:hypothetical protein